MHYSRAVTTIIASLLAVQLAWGEVLQEITVQEGQTLWSVANYYLKDPRRWPEILKYNKMPSNDPNVILPGIKLAVPMLLIKEALRAAHLVYAKNEVKVRRKSEAEWKTAVTNMELFNEDGLRTLQESRARVKFPSGEILQLDENSLIILRPEKTREEIDLLSGSVRASQTKVLTSDTVVDPKIVARGTEQPDFRTKLKSDKTTLVEVYAGIVDVTAQGRTVTINKGFGAEVKFRQPPSVPRELPPDLQLAEVNMPATKGNAVALTHNTSARVNSRFLELDIKEPPRPSRSDPSIQPHQNAAAAAEPKTKSKALATEKTLSRYHIQISSTSSFTTVLVDEINPITEKVRVDVQKYGLGDGTYYYRLSYVDNVDFEGKFSIPMQFIIDTAPPTVVIDTPQDNDEVDTEFVHIEGTTKPDAVLTINNKQVTADETGHFVAAIIPEDGANEIAVTAKDRSGNTAKTSITVYKVKEARASTQRVKKTHTALKEKGATFASTSLGVITITVILGVIILILT